MARASIYTLLNQDRFAAIVGLTPPHFNQAAGATYFPDVNACSDVWYQYAWQQQSNVSREDLAITLKEAEDDIANVLGFYPAPVWIEAEVHRYPQHHRRDVFEYGMANVRGMGKAVKTRYGKIIQAGQRAISLVEAGVAVVRSDDDGDGYAETATITTATTLTDECEIKCFFAGQSGAKEWEICNPRSVTLSGGNVTFVFYSWQLIDPDLWEAFPTTAGVNPIDLEAAGSYVTTVDIYREYTDFTTASAVLYWEPNPNLVYLPGIVGLCCSACGGTGCTACELTTQDGCIHVRDVDQGWVVPTPGSYDSDNSQWTQATMSVCRDPDQVKIYYYAGDQSQKYLQGQTCDPLSDYWAQAIAWMAVARLHKPFCSCNNTNSLAEEWQRDLRFTGSREYGSYQISPSELDNPFGTKFGEVMAWKRVSRLAANEIISGGAV